MSGIRVANAHQAFEFTDDQAVIGLVPIQRYAMLLSNGFAALNRDETHTGSRDRYPDPNGHFGAVGTVYYFDNPEAAWYDADTDGNRLIGY